MKKIILALMVVLVLFSGIHPSVRGQDRDHDDDDHDGCFFAWWDDDDHDDEHHHDDEHQAP